MAKIFGVSNHSPEVVVKALIKHKLAVTPSEIGIVPTNSKLSSRSRYKFLLFLTPTDLHRNVPMLSKSTYTDCKVFLFANPMRIHELSGVTPLDFEQNPEYPGFGFNLRSLSLQPVKTLKAESVVSRRNGKYLSKLVNYVRQGSLLNPLMTFLYTLPAANQSKVKVAVVKWLYLGKSKGYLEKALDSLEQVSITQRTKSKLADILFTQEGEAYQKAFSVYREQKKDSPNLIKIAKAHGVSDYEMRYILSIVEDSKRCETYIDSFDKAKNRKRA